MPGVGWRWQRDLGEYRAAVCLGGILCAFLSVWQPWNERLNVRYRLIDRFYNTIYTQPKQT